jgi:DNA-binding NarL/FixJ family response regulator
VVADATTGGEAVGLCELFVPDVVVASELLADGVVENFVPALLRTGSRVLVVCEPRETAALVELVALGVTGLALSDSTPRDLSEAVLTLAAGGAVFPDDVTAAVAADWRRSRRERGGDGRSAELTEREREVLGAISDGLSTKAVAHHLGIAIKTVEHHKSRIFDKLGVRTQAEAVAVALGTAGLMGTAAGDVPNRDRLYS